MQTSNPIRRDRAKSYRLEGGDKKGWNPCWKNVNPGDALVAKIPLQVSEEFENLLKTSSSEQKCLSANLDKQKMSISK